LPSISERRISLGEYVVSYSEWGRGEEILLLHGSDHRESRHVWDSFLSLAESYHLIIPDLIGYGGSSRPSETPDHNVQAQVLREMLERLSLTRVSLLGANWGGQVALEFALEWPERVKCLMLLASTYDKNQLSRLRKMGRPTLIIWAEDDLITQLKAGYLLRDAIGTSRLEIVPPVAKDPSLDFTVAHKLERYRSTEVIGLLKRFMSDPERTILEPPEMENELRGLALKREEDEKGGT